MSPTNKHGNVVVVGKHYWLEFEGCRVPIIFKVYNFTESGLVGGFLYNILTGEMSPSKGFRPQGHAWDSLGISHDQDATVTVRLENIHEEIKKKDLVKLKQVEKMKINYYFDKNVSKPFFSWRKN